MSTAPMTPEEKQAETDGDLAAWLSTPGGRRVFVRLLTQCGLWGPSFVAESSSSTAYNEGRRSLGIALMSEAQRVCLDKYLLAIKEQLIDASIQPLPLTEE